VLQKLLGKIKSGCSTCENCKDDPESPDLKLKSLCFERLHQNEKKQFLNLLQQTGRELSAKEMDVVDEFLSHEGHLSGDFIRKKLIQKGNALPLEEIERVLDLLCRYGLAQKVQLNGTGPWYEHLHLGEKHDHLMCTRCGKIVEFEDEEFKKQMKRSASLHGFQPLFQKTTIYGICPACKKKHCGSIPLAALSQGEKAVIVSFSGGASLKKRLSDMGLLTNEPVEVLSKSGPVILGVKGSRIAIGKGIAQKILVSPIITGKENT